MVPARPKDLRDLVPTGGLPGVGRVEEEVRIERIATDESLARVGLDLKDGILTGRHLLDSERLRADEHHVARPAKVAQQGSQLLEDDLEPLAVRHGSSSGGGRPLAKISMSRSDCSSPRPPTPARSTAS